MSDLEHLTEEEKHEVLKIYPKLAESVDNAVKKDEKIVEVNKVDEVIKEVAEEVGYTDGDYEKKTKDSDRLQYLEDEIEVEEEMVENG